jgi:hypothetical protein
MNGGDGETRISLPTVVPVSRQLSQSLRYQLRLTRYDQAKTNSVALSPQENYTD